MSEFDIGSGDAQRVILTIRDLSEASAQQLIKLLAKDPNLIEEMGMLLEDLDDPEPVPQVKKPETLFRLPDNSEIGIQTQFLKAMLEGNHYLVEKYLCETPTEILAKQLTVLANQDFPFGGTPIEPISYGNGSYVFLDRYEERIAASEDAPNILKLYAELSKVGITDSNNPLQVSDGIERRFERNEVDTASVASSLIDYSLGEGQYISGAVSSEITQVDDTLWGLSQQERLFVEIGCRDMGPRGRLEHLRKVFHTKPSERGKFSIRSFKKEGVTLLLLGNRVITFGWTRKLPRVPDWTRVHEPLKKKGTVNVSPDRQRRNRYSPLGE